MCKSRFITQLSQELKVWICPSESVDSACEITFSNYSPVDSLNCCWATEMRAIPSKQIVPGAGKCSIWCLYNVTFREYCPYPFSMEFARKIWTCTSRGKNILQPQCTNQCQTTLLRLEARARLSVPRFAHVAKDREDLSLYFWLCGSVACQKGVWTCPNCKWLVCVTYYHPYPTIVRYEYRFPWKFW